MGHWLGPTVNSLQNSLIFTHNLFCLKQYQSAHFSSYQGTCFFWSSCHCVFKQTSANGCDQSVRRHRDLSSIQETSILDSRLIEWLWGRSFLQYFGFVSFRLYQLRTWRIRSSGIWCLNVEWHSTSECETTTTLARNGGHHSRCDYFWFLLSCTVTNA
jgi:hypothetical protein